MAAMLEFPMPLFFPGRAPGRRWSVLAGMLSALLALAACSPTFNWRELRPEGTPLLVLMPCKPERAARTVPLAGAADTELHMHSCDAAGLTFAVAWAELGDPGRVEAALREWPRASLAALRLDPQLAESAQAQWAFELRGASQARGLVAQGSGPRGQAVQARSAYFAQGSKVFQAVVHGPDLPDGVTGTFFESLRLP